MHGYIIYPAGGTEQDSVRATQLVTSNITEVGILVLQSGLLI